MSQNGWTIEELSDADIAQLQETPGCCQSMRTGGIGDADAMIDMPEESTSDTTAGEAK